MNLNTKYMQGTRSGG